MWRKQAFFFYFTASVAITGPKTFILFYNSNNCGPNFLWFLQAHTNN